MPLRAIIKSSPETISDMILAADDRYLEAEELLLLHQYDGSVYLFGYAAEMWLKAACFRMRAIGPNEHVKEALGPLKQWMKQSAPTVQFTDFHDLSFYANCIWELRAAQGRPLSIVLSTEMRVRIVAGLYEEWIVDMRYRRAGLVVDDAWNAMQSAWWMKTNWTDLA